MTEKFSGFNPASKFKQKPELISEKPGIYKCYISEVFLEYLLNSKFPFKDDE